MKLEITFWFFLGKKKKRTSGHKPRTEQQWPPLVWPQSPADHSPSLIYTHWLTLEDFEFGISGLCLPCLSKPLDRGWVVSGDNGQAETHPIPSMTFQSWT